MAVVHALGGMPLTAFEPVGYGSGRYTLKGSWPTPKPMPSSGGGMSSGVSPPVEAPKSPGQALWPDLK
jgi:hypothetical protein